MSIDDPCGNDVDGDGDCECYAAGLAHAVRRLREMAAKHYADESDFGRRLALEIAANTLESEGKGS